MDVFADLQRRARERGPILLAIVGTGYFGTGLVRRSLRVPGLTPAVAANRTLERAVFALESGGIDHSNICISDDPIIAEQAVQRGQSVATRSLTLAAQMPSIDVVMETTGDVLVGAEIAMAAIAQRKHVVAANPEAQATVGPMLKVLADQAGVVYSDIDGDEPGILSDLVRYCRGIGFEPVVAGNCKGVLKRYATPETQAAFAVEHGLKPWIATAAADGTKLNLEMTVVANATGMAPAEPGMTGPVTSMDRLLSDFVRLGLLQRGPIVEYTLGIPNGVFVVFRNDEPYVQDDLRYLKMGDGPFYVLHRPHVLIHYSAPLSAAEAVLYGAATVAPAGPPVAETVTYAKKNLVAGKRLDGIGGFDCYGLIVRSEDSDGLLPIGMAGGAQLIRDVAQDEPIARDAVVFEHDNAVLALRRRQESTFPPTGKWMRAGAKTATVETDLDETSAGRLVQ